MSRNQGLSLLIGRLVSRIHQILGDRAFEDRGHSSSSCHMLVDPNEWASEPPSRSSLRGKTAPQCLRGLRRNPEPSFIGLQEDRTQDWKMRMIQHYLLCIFVYLSPPSEYTSSGVGERLRSLACCSPWCCKELDTAEQMSLTELIRIYATWKSPCLSTSWWYSDHLIVVQSLSRVWLFSTSQSAAHQASLSPTISQCLLKLMSIESVMLCNRLILCHLLLLLPSIRASGSFPMSWLFLSGGQSIGASTSASVLAMNSQGLVSFRIDWSSSSTT